MDHTIPNPIITIEKVLEEANARTWFSRFAKRSAPYTVQTVSAMNDELYRGTTYLVSRGNRSVVVMTLWESTGAVLTVGTAPGRDDPEHAFFMRMRHALTASGFAVRPSVAPVSA